MPTLTPNLLTTPSAPNTAKTASNSGKPDDTPEQTFGAVLARQLDAGQATGEAAATLKASKRSLHDTLAADGKDTATNPAASDPAANLIAMLQAPLELRSSASPAAPDTTAVAADPGVASTVLDKLAAKPEQALRQDKDQALSSVHSEKAVDKFADKPDLSAAAQADALKETAKPDVSAVIVADTIAAAPRAQDVAAFTAPTMNAVPPAAPQQATTSIATPMGSSVWADDFAQQITWMASGKQEQTASLHLNPPDLGPMQVVVKVADSQATVLFTSPHGAVREAIENAMPKLREMMADNGITLGNTSVSDQAPRERNEANDSGAARRDVWSSNDGNDDGARVSSVRTATVRQRGMVDTFA